MNDHAERRPRPITLSQAAMRSEISIARNALDLLSQENDRLGEMVASSKDEEKIDMASRCVETMHEQFRAEVFHRIYQTNRMIHAAMFFLDELAARIAAKNASPKPRDKRQ